MTLWDVILIIGVLLIVNGIFQTQHAYITQRVDTDARKNMGDITYGASGRLFGIINNQIWIETDKNGKMGKAKGVRSGLFKMAKAFETDFKGANIHTFEPVDNMPKHIAGPVCAAKRNYLKAYEYDRRKKRK